MPRIRERLRHETDQFCSCCEAPIGATRPDLPVGVSVCEPCLVALSAELTATTLTNMSLYGISRSDYWALYVKQGGRCAICSLRAVELPQRLNVDHDHDPGTVRGLLCRECNLGLGHFRDRTIWLNKAAVYLRRPPAS